MISVDRKRASANIRVPVGSAAIWAAILQVADENAGRFTIAAVDAACDQPLSTIIDYVTRLDRRKIVSRVTRRGGLFQVNQRPKAAPPNRPEQEHLWTAMRALKSFTVNELCYAATTDTQKIPRPFARRYVERLVEAGYLSPGKPTGDDKSLVYRLKPGMSNGPLAPVVIRMVAVFDRNTNSVIEDVMAEEFPA